MKSKDEKLTSNIIHLPGQPEPARACDPQNGDGSKKTLAGEISTLLEPGQMAVLKRTKELIEKEGGGVLMLYITPSIQEKLNDEVEKEKQGLFINLALAKALRMGKDDKIQKRLRSIRKEKNKND